MAIIDLYNNQKAFLAPSNTDTYEEFVFTMERAGVNDLVARNKVDPTFRPPEITGTYTENLFKDSVTPKQL